MDGSWLALPEALHVSDPGGKRGGRSAARVGGLGGVDPSRGEGGRLGLHKLNQPVGLGLTVRGADRNDVELNLDQVYERGQ